MAELQSSNCLPHSGELKEVLRLGHLANILELQSKYDEPVTMFDDEPETPEQRRAWREALHRAFYRSFIGAASLSNVYMEPIRNTQVGPALDPQKPRQYAALVAQRSAAYNPRLRPQQDHEVFGSFGDWLFQDILSDTSSRAAMEETFRLNQGRAYGCRERSQLEPGHEDDELTRARRGCPIQAGEGLSHADAHLLALELLRLLWTCGCMAEQRPFRGLSPPRLMGGTCGPIFLWNVFEPVLVAFEESPVSTREGSAPCCLYLREPDEAQPSDEEPVMYPQALLEIVDQDDDRRRELAAEFVFTPPTRYKFFVYFLHRHLRAAFERAFFEPEEGQVAGDNFNSFLGFLRIFARDDSEDAISYYPEPMGDFGCAQFLDGTDVLLPWEPPQDSILMED